MKSEAYYKAIRDDLFRELQMVEKGCVTTQANRQRMEETLSASLEVISDLLREVANMKRKAEIEGAFREGPPPMPRPTPPPIYDSRLKGLQFGDWADRKIRNLTWGVSVLGAVVGFLAWYVIQRG
jgi:hypothetical protein